MRLGFVFDEHDAEIQCGFSIELVRGRLFRRCQDDAGLAELLRFNFQLSRLRLARDSA